MNGIKDLKDKYQPSDIPWLAIKSILDVRIYGNKKYAPHTFYLVQPKLHLDACLRHLMEVYITLTADQNDMESAINPESGLMHLEHALCDLAGVVEILRRNNKRRGDAVYKEMLKEKSEALERDDYYI